MKGWGTAGTGGKDLVLNVEHRFLVPSNVAVGKTLHFCLVTIFKQWSESRIRWALRCLAAFQCFFMDLNISCAQILSHPTLCCNTPRSSREMRGCLDPSTPGATPSPHPSCHSQNGEFSARGTSHRTSPREESALWHKERNRERKQSRSSLFIQCKPCDKRWSSRPHFHQEFLRLTNKATDLHSAPWSTYFTKIELMTSNYKLLEDKDLEVSIWRMALAYNPRLAKIWLRKKFPPSPSPTV